MRAKSRLKKRRKIQLLDGGALPTKIQSHHEIHKMIHKTEAPKKIEKARFWSATSRLKIKQNSSQRIRKIGRQAHSTQPN